MLRAAPLSFCQAAIIALHLLLSGGPEAALEARQAHARSLLARASQRLAQLRDWAPPDFVAFIEAGLGRLTQELNLAPSSGPERQAAHPIGVPPSHVSGQRLPPHRLHMRPQSAVTSTAQQLQQPAQSAQHMSPLLSPSPAAAAAAEGQPQQAAPPEAAPGVQPATHSLLPQPPHQQQQQQQQQGAAVEHCCLCGAAAPSPARCGRCRTTVYCSRRCQMEHWLGGHREECTRIVTERFNERVAVVARARAGRCSDSAAAATSRGTPDGDDDSDLD